MFFLDAFSKTLKRQYDDDSIDRLNYFITPMLLIIFSVTLSAKQYVGQPIQCWIPAQFTGAWEQYSENYCFVQNTYFVRPDAHLPDSTIDREAQEIGYYQWVPFILGIQAILFYLPQLVWRFLNWQSGVAIKQLVKMSKDGTTMQLNQREGHVQIVSSHIFDALNINRKLKNFSTFSFVHNGTYLSFLYLTVKALYLIQCFAQFFILNQFLSTSYTFWGFGILGDLVRGREWEESGHFPRVTMCDFEVRVLGNKHRHTIQCVLMINMFNEKVYLVLWFWLLAVTLLTLFNFVCWAANLLVAQRRREFVMSYLRTFKLVSDEELANERAVTRFINKDLRMDGIFLLRLISKNAGDIITPEIVSRLWIKFLHNENKLIDTAPPLDDVDGFHEKAPLN